MPATSQKILSGHVNEFHVYLLRKDLVPAFSLILTAARSALPCKRRSDAVPWHPRTTVQLHQDPIEPMHIEVKVIYDCILVYDKTNTSSMTMFMLLLTERKLDQKYWGRVGFTLLIWLAPS